MESSDMESSDMESSAMEAEVQKARAEWLRRVESNRDALCDLVSRFTGADQAFAVAVNARNINAIGDALQTTWDVAPDEPWIHGLTGWHVLCDLCADYMFGGVCVSEDEEQDDPAKN